MLLFGILVCIMLRIRIKESGRKEGPVIGCNKGASYVIENVGNIKKFETEEFMLEYMLFDVINFLKLA